MTVPPVLADTAGLRWLDCTPVLVIAPVLLTLPDGLATVPVAVPAVCVPEALSLIAGVVLTIEDLEAELPFVVVTREDVPLLVTTLSDVVCFLVVVLPAIELFLLTVLELPMPPLKADLPPEILSDPVWCLDPYQTLLSCSDPPMWPGP